MRQDETLQGDLGMSVQACSLQKKYWKVLSCPTFSSGRRIEGNRLSRLDLRRRSIAVLCQCAKAIKSAEGRRFETRGLEVASSLLGEQDSAH